MSCFFLDKDISILLVSMDLFSEQELFVLLRDNPIFTNDFIEYTFMCQSPQRRRELLLSRLLFLYIMQSNNVNILFFNSIKKKKDLLINSYYLSNKKVYLSVSHTHSWMVITANLTSYIVIDIESPQRNVDKIKLFFTKKIKLDDISENVSILSLWTVYEALCKLNVSKEFRKKILDTVVLELKKSREEINKSSFYLCIPVDNYKIFIWKDKLIPGPGCLITSKTQHKKIRLYTIGRAEHKIGKPCKEDLTRLLTCDEKIEINF